MERLSLLAVVLPHETSPAHPKPSVPTRWDPESWCRCGGLTGAFCGGTGCRHIYFDNGATTQAKSAVFENGRSTH